MPLRLVVTDDGRTGVDLRRHRGDHELKGTGNCRRLAQLLPAHATDDGTTALLSFDLVQFLSYGLLVPGDDILPEYLYRYLVGHERMGVALDHALAGVTGDSPRDLAVLRAELSAIAARDRTDPAKLAEYTAVLGDLYQVATVFPHGVGIDDIFDWIGLVTFQELIPAEGTLVVVGELEQSLRRRFDPDVALKVGGVFDRLSRAITLAIPAEEGKILVDATAEETAATVTSWLVRVLPTPPEICELQKDALSANLALRRVLAASH